MNLQDTLYYIRTLGGYSSIVILSATLAFTSVSWRVRRGATVALALAVMGLGLLLTDMFLPG